MSETGDSRDARTPAETPGGPPPDGPPAEPGPAESQPAASPAAGRVTPWSTSSAPSDDSADVLDFPRRGAEERRVRRPLRWLVGVLVALAAVGAFAAVVFYSPLLAVREITVEGTDRLDAGEISEALQPLEGVPLTRVDDATVRDLVGENILVRDVRAEAHPPHELVVEVTERVPVATVQEGDQYVLVDADGVAVGAVGSAEEAGVPLVDGGLDAVGGEGFGELVRVLQALPQSLLEQMQKAEAVSDSELRLQMRNGSTVVWGTAEDSEFKAEVLLSLTRALGQQGAGLTYDVSSPEYPVTRGAG
ncbi:cell division protein FtsQ/DivIB [Rothia sp. AR01]|uniref:Cell division protein FtsQ/DivIB n=1 Tax=Rothia santali TaxID=2949643 RepID=A0A9X2KI18_9MICC|nr:cell division protein FtsQ/DivIB [Rothia santali]MCP3425530.1 cell division protein FtsQ/DivIB [Rothia santali]